MLPGVKLTEHAGSDKSVVFTCQDFSEETTGKQEKFCLRFGSIESEFKSTARPPLAPACMRPDFASVLLFWCVLAEVEGFRKAFGDAQKNNAGLGVGAAEGTDPDDAGCGVFLSPSLHLPRAVRLPWNQGGEAGTVDSGHSGGVTRSLLSPCRETSQGASAKKKPEEKVEEGEEASRFFLYFSHDVALRRLAGVRI